MPTITQDITITVPGDAAAKVIARAQAITVAEEGWRLRDGSQTSDARRALTEALVAIAEDGSPDTIEDPANAARGCSRHRHGRHRLGPRGMGRDRVQRRRPRLAYSRRDRKP